MESLGKQIDYLLCNPFIGIKENPNLKLRITIKEDPTIKLRMLYALVTLSAQQSSEYFNRDN